MKGYCTMLALGNYGRFANGAYQVAGVLGVARRNGLTPVFPLWQNLDHRDGFGSLEDIDVYKHFINPLPLIPEGVTFSDRPVEWGYHDVDLPAGNWNISGHFQSARYFEHCFDEVKWYLRMKDEPRQNDFVAIHVRLTDYDNAYHPRLGMEYYAPAMAMFHGARFLVFSDDIPAARMMMEEIFNSTLSVGSHVSYSEGRDYITDFRLMKSCRHFIIGNSSYSAMAALLGEAGDKRVIAPRPWFGHQYAAKTGEDIYGSDWEVINWELVA